MTWGPVAAPPSAAARARDFGVVRQRVRLAYDATSHTLEGSTTVRLAPRGDSALSRIVLDVGRVVVRAVRDERGDSLDFALAGDTLAILLGPPPRAARERELRIEYDIEHAADAIGEADGGGAYWTRGGSPRHWVPTVDDPASRSRWELIVRALPGEIVRASGRLAGRRRVRGGVEWRFVVDEPVAASRIGVVVGKLSVATDTSHRPVLALWSTRRPTADERRALAALRRMDDALDERIGDGPDGARELVALPDGAPDEWHGAGLTTMLEDAVVVPAWAVPQLDPLVRLARAAVAQRMPRHVASATDAWVGDALPSLLAWELASPTPDDASWRRLDAMDIALAAERRERRPLAGSPTGRSAARGAVVLDMLRAEVGDSAYRAGLRAYLAGDTTELERAMTVAAGRDLSPFFAQWVRGSGYPAFAVRWSYDASARRLTLVVRQTQPRDAATGRFDAAVDLEAHFTDGSRARRWRIDASADSTAVAFDSVPPIRWLTWDAGDRLLDETDLPRSTLMLAEQLRWDTSLAGRRSALVALAERTTEPLAVRALEHALRADVFWGIRQLAVAPLGRLRGDTLARNALLDATNDPDARVRDAAVRALAEFPGEVTVARARIVALTDASIFVRAAALETFAVLDPARALPDLRQALARDSWHDVLRAGALAALAHVDSATAWALARAHVGADASPWARRAAVAALLAHRAGRDADLALVLDPLLEAREASVRAAAVEALGLLRVPGLAVALEARRDVEHDASVLDAIARALRALGEAGVGSR